jgi:hypothetical protein
MIMAAPTISEYFKYAQLQMAAEAFLVNDAGNPLSGSRLINALKKGNDRKTKFVESEAIKFESEWRVVHHCENTETGFSGTLFRCKTTDEARGLKAGEYVISFRSTEFIDDAIRDSASTNTLEVHDTGWAWGQISDMEAWYAELKESGLLPSTARPAVTGYSLGGHLATAFNLLHSNEIGQVITFNGAGVGEINRTNTWQETAEGLRNALTYFDTLRNDSAKLRTEFERGVTDAKLMAFYDTVCEKFTDEYGNLNVQGDAICGLIARNDAQWEIAA